MSRRDLATRAHTLQLSLLTSLGLLPLACGGSAMITGGDPSAGGSAGLGGATVTNGGSGPVISRGGSEFGGAPSSGGTAGMMVGGGGSRAIGGTGGSTGGSGGGTQRRVCEKPTTDPVTQLVKCADGVQHRPGAVMCSLPTGVMPSEGGAGGAIDNAPCTMDADCSSLRLGYCHYSGGGGFDLPSCQSGCLQDSDCTAGSVCLCNGSTHGGECTVSTCQNDAQCGPNSLCARAYQICGDATFACQIPADTCQTEADCGGDLCAVQGESRSCFHGACGRPFLVEESARMADITRSSEWLDETARMPHLRGLSPRARTALSAHWSRLAQMEHASIAAFARFNLQLLSLGAPASLIDACTRAIADETAHTRLCFELASHYGGTPLGPSPLDISQCLNATSLAEIMKLVLLEGCLGETSAALEAAEAAAIATDSAVKSAFARIARDEQRHAELAFRFLSWALAQSPEAVRIELALEAERRLQQFERALSPAPRTTDLSQAELSAHGCLSADALDQIHRHAARGVVAPLLSALFSAHSAAASASLARSRSRSSTRAEPGELANGERDHEYEQ